MKKFISSLLVLALCIVPLVTFSGCEQRSEVLHILSQGEYMEPELYEDFKVWYKEKTGLNIRVEMADAEHNEFMFTEISGKKVKYDLMCPSDYMIEKMISKDLLEPINKERINIEEVILPTYLNKTREFDPELAYSVPYMYGTFGIMYNYKLLGNEHLDSWASLFEANPKFNGKTTMKKSTRDTYTAACMFLSPTLDGVDNGTEAYQKKVQAVFDDTSAATIKNVENLLSSMVKNFGKWDNEDGKTAMAAEEFSAGLYWSCDAGFVMRDYEIDGTPFEGNKNLWYTIPKEGGNIYLDSFVIPKKAENKAAAGYFLEYLCTKEVALMNSEYIGAVSPVKLAYDELYEQYNAAGYSNEEKDKDSPFFNTSAEWKAMFIDMMFPSDETLNRCGMMRDYGKDEDAVTQMMSNFVA